MELSFEELEDPLLEKSKAEMKQSKKRSDLIQYEWQSKLDLLDIKIKSASVFPLKIYNTDFLKNAVKNFDYDNSRNNMLKKAIGMDCVKKSCVYLFWIFFAIKFKEITELDIKLLLSIWRKKLQEKYVLFYREFKPQDKILESMPFIFGYTIRLIFETKVRYGEKILDINEGVIEIYQIVFKELAGIFIDAIYVQRHLKKFSMRDFTNIVASNVAEFMKHRDYKDYLNNRLHGPQNYLKQSKIQRDKFEHELSLLINSRFIEKVLQKADEFKYPPMDYYEKFINKGIMDHDISKRVSRQKSQMQFETSRVSPMLRSYIEGETSFKKQNSIMISYKQIMESPNSKSIMGPSTISIESPKLQLPEVRAKKMNEVLQDSIEKSINNKVKIRKQLRNFKDSLRFSPETEKRITQTSFLPQSIHDKRKRFINVKPDDDEVTIKESPTLAKVNSMSLMLKSMPKFNQRLIQNKLPAFPVFIRKEDELEEGKREHSIERTYQLGQQGIVPLNYSSPEFQQKLETERNRYKKRQERLQKQKEFKIRFKSPIDPRYCIETNRTPEFDEDNQEVVEEKYDFIEEKKIKQSKSPMSSFDILVQQRQKEMRKKLLVRNNMHFNRSIRIQRDIINKDEGEDEEQRIKKMNMDFEQTFEKFLALENEGLWIRDDLEQLDKKIKK